MSTDRELLEAAAKAAGVPAPWSHDKLAAFQFQATYWNPLTDDGDALRLAVKLRLSISHEECECCVWCAPNLDSLGDESVSVQERMHRVDEERESLQSRAAATRRAIVRAAAALPPSAPPTQAQKDQ